MLHPGLSHSIRKPTTYHTLFILLVFAGFLAVGLANLYSAAADTHYFRAQLNYLPLGLLTFVIVAWGIPIRQVQNYAYVPFVLAIGSLLAVLVLGHSAGGAQRWIKVGPVGFQPSEAAKLAVILYVAKYIANNKLPFAYRLSDLAPMAVGVLSVFVLIFLQPDFGTAGICLLIAGAQILFLRIELSRRNLMAIIVSCAGLLVSGWLFFLRPYQRLRILTLLDPTKDPSGSGYNSLQSLVAIGSGGQFGKGYLQGTQSQLQFLPARHTDFVFSVFAEEHGFWAGSLVFALFGVLAYIALEVAREAKDSFNSLVAVGVAAFLFVEFSINIAMVLGMFPVVGMPLPFFSYGGSAFIVNCAAVGLLVCIDRDTMKKSRSSLET